MGCNMSKFKLELNGLDVTKVEETGASVKLAEEIKAVTTKRSSSSELLANWATREEYKKAVESGDNEHLLNALNAAMEPMSQLKEIIDYAEEVSLLLVDVIKFFIQLMPISSKLSIAGFKKKISQNWIVICELASILSAISKLDDLASQKPDIQNDLSLVKRFVNKKNRLLNLIQSENEENEAKENSFVSQINSWKFPEGVEDATLTEMVHFFRSNSPFITKCSKKIETAILDSDENSQYDEILQQIPNIFLAAIEANLPEKEHAAVFAEATVCSAVIVDRLLPEGIFHAKAFVDVLGIVAALTENRPELLPGVAEEDAHRMLRQLRFWSMHFKDERTPEKLHNSIIRTDKQT